jgi:hypothetical protein
MQRLPSRPESPPASPAVASGTANSPPTTSPSPSGIPSVSTASGPAATVLAYFAAISSKAYAKAWRLGGSKLDTSYTSFVDGFANTVSDKAAILSVSGNVVTVRLVAQETDGTVKTYQGTYTVTGGAIASANVYQVG